MILCNFLKDAQLWIATEEKNVIEKKGKIPQILLDVFGSTASSFGEIVVERQSSFDLLNASKLEVLAELNSNPDHIVSLLTSRQASIVESIQSDTDTLGTYMTDLVDGVNTRPPKVTDKARTRQTIEDVQRVLNQTRNDQGPIAPPADPLQGLVEDGIITQDELDAYTAKNPISRRRTVLKTIQVVRELRDRYYKVEPTDTREVLDVENASGVDIVDDEGKIIDAVGGYKTAELSPDGTITLTGVNGATEILYLQPKNQKKRSNSPNKTRRSFDLEKDAIRDEYAYEAWACGLFRLVERIQQIVENIADKVDNLIEVADISERILNQTPLGTAFNFSATVLNDLYALNDTEEFEIGDRVLEFVGLTRSASLNVNPGSNTTFAICQANEAIFCKAAVGYQNVFDFLSGLLDSLDLSFGFDLDGLSEIVIRAFEAIISITQEMRLYVLRLRQESRKLFGDICAFISRGIRGTPKSANEINETIGLIVGLLALAPQAILTGLNNSVRIGKIILRLTRAGYDAAALALANGQIEKFLSMRADQATHAARAAICLEDAAATTNNASLYSKLNRLAQVSQTRADRLTTAQRINEGMHRRFISNDLGVEIAKNVRNEGWKGIQEARRND